MSANRYGGALVVEVFLDMVQWWRSRVGCRGRKVVGN